ncbi:MAG: phage holin family protein [Oscillospiraceae bacterium]|nr:phage holin family protein [Oscillospiraceae bacterium]
MDRMIEWGKLALGAVVTAISAFFGGMDGVMYALLIFISIDYLTGVAVAIKQKQLSSEVGFWGLVRKVCILALVGVAHIIDIDVITTGDVFRTAVSLYYIGNEGISILENTTNLGVKYPQKLMSILQQIRDNAEKDSE